MASLFTNEQLPASSEQAIREFNEKYLAVISAAPPSSWAERFRMPVGSPRTTFPISLISTKFRETKEESSRFKTMTEKDFDLKVVEFDAGYEAEALSLTTNSFAYRNWSRAPEKFRIGESRHVARQLATLLEAGGTELSPWDGIAFFSAASHLANPSDSSLGTFGNFEAAGTAPTIANIQAQATLMRAVKDENGDKLGV